VVSQLNHQQAAEVEKYNHFTTGFLALRPTQGRASAPVVHLTRTARETAPLNEEMGDRKPSQFLRHLKSLTPDIPDDYLRTIWASRLPPHVQAILAGQTEGSLDSTSRLDDRICEVTPLPTTGSISPSTPDNPAGLLERIEEISRQVASLQALQTNRRSQSRDRHRPHSRNRFSNTTDNTVQPREILWYHWKF